MKRIIPLLLVLCIIISIAACGTRVDTPTEASAANKPEKQDVTTLSCFIAHPWYPVDTFTGIIPEQITKDTGVSLNLTIAVDAQQLSILISSGDLPDLVYTDSQLDKLSNSEICFSYDELINKYNVDWDIEPALRDNSLLNSSDGKLYCIRNHFPSKYEWNNAVNGVQMAPSMSIRKDILDKLGNPRLETLYDLDRIYEQVKLKYPDMIPMVFDPSWRFDCFRVWTGVTKLDWIKQPDGTYKFYTNTPAYKKMLKLLNSFYLKGYLVSDNFAEIANQTSDWYSVGKAFSTTTCTQNGNIGYDNKLKALDISYESIECPPLDNRNYITSDIGWSGTFISKTCSNPEAAIKFMKYMFTPYAQKLCQMGREGIDYQMDTSTGLPVFCDEWNNAIKNNTHNSLYNPWFYFGGSELIEALARCASLPSYTDDYDTVYDIIRKGYNNEPWIAAATPIGATEEKVILDKMNDMIFPFEAKIILSSSDYDFENNYNELMKASQSVGLENLEKYMSKQILLMEKKYK